MLALLLTPLAMGWFPCDSCRDCPNPCNMCITGRGPSRVQLQIEDLAITGDSACPCNELNGTYILERAGDCRWAYRLPSMICITQSIVGQPYAYLYLWLDNSPDRLRIELRRFEPGGAEVNIDLYSTPHAGAGNITCTEWSNESLAWMGAFPVHCDTSTTTANITAL